jgi:transcriptional regulator of acetoin/glycerol metabolism
MTTALDESSDALLCLFDDRGTLRTLVEVERIAIMHAVIACQGNLVKVAIALGIGRSTLYRKLDEYGIKRGEP